MKTISMRRNFASTPTNFTKESRDCVDRAQWKSYRGVSAMGGAKLLTLAVVAAAFVQQGCQTAVSTGTEAVYLPFLKNTPNECYYLDEFMPVPDGLVSGKNG